MLTFSGADIERRKRFIASLKPGQVVVETLKLYRKPKTDQQVRTIWGLLIETVKQGLDEMGFDMAVLFPTAQIPPGIPCPREVLMQVFYAACNDVGEMGERKTLSQMNTIEAATFFDKCRDHAASVWGIVVPDPDPNWRMKRTDTGDVSPQGQSGTPPADSAPTSMDNKLLHCPNHHHIYTSSVGPDGLCPACKAIGKEVRI